MTRERGESSPLRRRIDRQLRTLRVFGRTRSGLLIGFGAVHFAYILALLPTIISGGTAGDLPLYRAWAESTLNGFSPLIREDWVYPAGALGPIVLADVFGPYLYQLMWLLITAAGNLAAIWVLTRGFRNIAGYTASWYWLLTQVLLAPISMLRLEGMAAPFVIAALVLVARRPTIAGALIAAATWIKVWPAAVAAAAFTGSTKRWWIAIGGGVTTAIVAAAIAIAGGSEHLFSFITVQSDRTLQLEAPIATPWVWAAILEVRGAEIYQNFALATREVAGPGSEIAATAVGIAMFAAIALVLVAVITGRRRLSVASRTFGAAAARRAEVRLIVLASFVLAAALIVFNKVGSPQYMLWVAPIVVAGLFLDPVRWNVPARWLAAIGFLTSLVFPILYMPLIDGNPIAATVLTLRNVGIVGMFVWSCVELSRCAADPARLAWTPLRVRRGAVIPTVVVPDATGPHRIIA